MRGNNRSGSCDFTCTAEEAQGGLGDSDMNASRQFLVFSVFLPVQLQASDAKSRPRCCSDGCHRRRPTAARAAFEKNDKGKEETKAV
eukprot:768760-Hanusia_phi.AAC.4